MKHIKTLKIDIDKKNFEVIPSVQYDSNTRFLHIQLLNNSVPCDITGCSVILSGVKEDGTSIFNSCDVINPEIAFIQAEITEQMNVIPGLIDCEIKIYDGEGVLTSKKFTIKVTDSQTSRSVVSSNEFKALTDALNKVQAIDSKAEKAEVEKLTSQLDTKAQKNEVRVSTDIKPINISEMDTETKKLFTGGAVPVVDEDSVREENIVNKSVSYQKTKGINYFNNINKTSNNFYKDIKFFETNNCNLEIRNGEVYFINTISKDWLYDDISDSDEISFIMTNREAWIKISELDSNNFTMFGIGNGNNGKVLDVKDGTLSWLQQVNNNLNNKINIGDEVSIIRNGYEYSVYCNSELVHSFSLLALSSISNKHKFGIVVTLTMYKELTTIKPLVKEIIVKNKEGVLENLNLELLDINNSIKKITSDINADIISNETLYYDTEKVEFKFKDNNSTLIANIKVGSTGIRFHPCFFNRSGTMKFEFVNQDTFIILAKNDNNYLALALGNKNGKEEISGRIIKFDYSNGYSFLRQAHLDAPNLNDVITISYYNKILELYYNNVLIHKEDINLYGLDEMEDNFGVVKTSANDSTNQGLIKNISIESIPIYDYVKENRSKIVSLENKSNSYYKDTYGNFLGDSITQGVGTTKQYHQFTKEQLGLKDVRNYGIGGTCITNIESNNFISRYLSMDNNAELIVVFGGTNDFGHHMPLGDINSTDDKTFYGALKVLCEGLINKYPGKTIIFITPLNRNCDKFPADGCPKGQKTNNLGYKLEDYVNAIKEVVPMYSIPAYDLFSNSNLYPYNTSIITNFMPDGLHPNINGHKIIGRKTSEFINRQ